MSERLNRAEFVIQKYRLNEITFIEDEVNGKKLGQGKVMADETLQRFMDSDPSGNLKYLDWMIFMAGGGQEAMEKSLQLWAGSSETDANSLRNQCHADFLSEQTNGYTDENGTHHSPVSAEQAEINWEEQKERSRFEFVMGDQDVAAEDGYGFFRHWPGRNGIYQKIVNTIKLWHMAQPKLLAQNQRVERFKKLETTERNEWTPDDRAFVLKAREEKMPDTVVLDIYSGWKPKELSQAGAVYKTMSRLLRTLADVRKMQILRDVRFVKIYEDEFVLAVCPLTIGASIKFGLGKWCVCNRSEFDRSFENYGGGVEGNWQRYNRTGPLVFMRWKVPMPPWLHMIAMHLKRESLGRVTVDNVNWVDCLNQQVVTSYEQVRARIAQEREGTFRFKDNDDIALPAAGGSPSDEKFYKWGGRAPGPAWNDSKRQAEITLSLTAVVKAVTAWAKGFNPDSVVLDYVTDIGSAVDNSDE